MRRLRRRRSVRLAFDGLESRALLSVVPNDPNFSQQWALNDSSAYGINAPEAWDITTGSSSVVMAELGVTGVDVSNQPDLDPRLESGLDFNNGASGVPLGTPSGYHDTAVAGIAAAVTNNASGIAGVTWNGSIIPLEVSTIQDNKDAVAYAIQHGAKIINMSFTYSESSLSWSTDPLYQEMQAAENSGLIFVASAGNGGQSQEEGNPGGDLDTVPDICPAAFNLPDEITVAGIDSSGNLDPSSNYGPNTVPVAAPGVNVLSFYSSSQTGDWSGTSFSAPMVTGVAALVESEFPSLSASQVIQLIEQNTKADPALSGMVGSGGTVNAYNALLAGFSMAGYAAPTASASPATFTGTTATLSVADPYGAGGDAGLTYTWNVTSMPSGAATPTFSVNGTNAAKSTVATFDAAGSYAFQATISNGQGFSKTASVSVTVSPQTQSPVEYADDSQPGSSFSETGSWTQYTGEGFDSTHSTATGTGGAATATATWTFTGLQPGYYQVSATWIQATNRATNSPFTVYDGTTALGTVQVNQQLPPLDISDQNTAWGIIGQSYDITSGTLSVELTNAATAGYFVVADGIRITRVGNLPSGGPMISRARRRRCPSPPCCSSR